MLKTSCENEKITIGVQLNLIQRWSVGTPTMEKMAGGDTDHGGQDTYHGEDGRWDRRPLGNYNRLNRSFISQCG